MTNTEPTNTITIKIETPFGLQSITFSLYELMGKGCVVFISSNQKIVTVC